MKKYNKMPVLFVGHGNPMNAITDNEFTAGWRSFGEKIPRPSAILCISAYWETKGTFVTAMEKPPTIHDFGGFPKELYEVQYPASGSPELASEVIRHIRNADVTADQSWGLDHGCWSVVKHLFPIADIPVIQLSLDYYRKPAEHYNLAKELSSLREKGILIIGSGNIVHNLRLVAWDKLEEPGFSYEWATTASDKIKKLIMSNDYASLCDYKTLGKEVNLAIPTPEHFLPLLYTLALKEPDDTISFFNDKAVAGSLTMTCVEIGL